MGPRDRRADEQQERERRAMTQAADPIDRPAAPSRRRPDAFAAADRHSARVRWLRRALIAAGALAALGVAAIAWLDPFRALPEKVSLQQLGISGSRVTMELPKLAGFRRDGKPYSVTARTAVQDVKRANLIELTDLDANIGLNEHGAAHIVSAAGLYDSAKETMELRKDVLVKTESGYEVRLNSATINFPAGTMVSNEPVTALVRNSTIKSDSMRMSDGGKTLVFEGKVRTSVLPIDETSGAPAPQKGPMQ